MWKLVPKRFVKGDQELINKILFGGILNLSKLLNVSIFQYLIKHKIKFDAALVKICSKVEVIAAARTGKLFYGSFLSKVIRLSLQTNILTTSSIG